MADHQTLDKDERNVAVVMVPCPFQGHLNQLLNLSCIISSYEIPVYYTGIPTYNRQVKMRAQGWDPLTISSLHFHDIPIPSFDAPLPDPNDPSNFPSHVFPLFSSMFHLREPIFALLRKLAKTSKRIVVIIDFVMSWVIQDVSSVPNAELYYFQCFPAFVLYYLVHAFAEKPFYINGEPVKDDFPPLDRVFQPEHMSEFFRKHLKSEKCYHGNLYNSCRVIEGQFLDFLAEEKIPNTERHWAIGPFNQVSFHEKKTSNKYLEWLDKQKPKSVIFVSFGTTTSLSDEQVKEMALGLERSGQNFMWVLRYADRADCSGGEICGIAQLPERFEERVEGRGIIIRDWAPQLEILGHPSTGGFMSHCGWNSCMESLSMGVPIAAWPMHSDQPLNAILISQVLKIGLLVRECTAQVNEIVSTKTVEEVVKRLMASAEGDELRQRAAELSSAVMQSLKDDGVTVAERANFIAHISR